MSTARRIAEIPAGSWSRWVVVGFWLVVLVVMFPLSGKLTGAEKNDAKAWLPANAESTKVLDLQAHFQPPNTYAAVVVYQRESGLTAPTGPRRRRTPGVSPGSTGSSRAP